MADFKTPADLGIAASKKDATFTQKQKFMHGYLDDFRAFVLDSMADGFDIDFADHNDFIRAAFETFVELDDEERSDA